MTAPNLMKSHWSSCCTYPSLSKAVKHASISRNFESSTNVLLLMLFVCRIVAMSVLGDAKCGPTVSAVYKYVVEEEVQVHGAHGELLK